MSTDVLAPPRSVPGTEPMDPRLRARRREVARDTGRRRRRRLVLAFVVVVLAGAAIGLTRSPLLDVDRVRVRGAGHTGAAAAVEAAGIEPGRALVSVDAAAAEARLEALPWVQRASVSWSWTGTVSVDLEERTAVALVGSGRELRLVDRTGRVLGPAPASLVLPGVAGPAPAVGARLPAASRAAVATVADLPRDLAAEVVAARSGTDGIELELDDGIEVAWGPAGRTSAKAHDLRLLLAQAGRATIARIDVSVPGAPALTRRPGGEG